MDLEMLAGFQLAGESLGGSGGGERKRGRWTDGCPVAARGWGVAEDPPVDWGLS